MSSNPNIQDPAIHAEGGLVSSDIDQDKSSYWMTRRRMSKTPDLNTNNRAIKMQTLLKKDRVNSQDS